MSTKSSTEAIIEVKEVSKRYGRTLALDGVSLEVGGGELFALLGPNGAGKTTLVHILCTIHQPDGGTARVAGFDVVRQPLRARQRIGVVFQEPSLDDRLTAFENLDFHGRIYGVPAPLRRKRINEMLELVELADRREHLVRSFSSGMKRRLETVFLSLTGREIRDQAAGAREQTYAFGKRGESTHGSLVHPTNTRANIWRSSSMVLFRKENVPMHDRIVIDPEIQHGKPIIRGTRVPVSRIVGGLAGNMTTKEIVREYEISEEDVLAALNYAAELIEAQEFHPLPAPTA